MSLLRDDYTTALAEMHAHGMELLERYRDLIDQDVVSVPTATLLRQVIDKREAMLRRVEGMARARGDLPKAANEERALVRAIADWINARVRRENALILRLIEAEEQWRGTIEDALELDWSEDEQDVLSQLIIHSERLVDDMRFLQSSL